MVDTGRQSGRIRAFFERLRGGLKRGRMPTTFGVTPTLPKHSVDFFRFEYRYVHAARVLEQLSDGPRVPSHVSVSDTHIAPFSPVHRLPHFVSTTITRHARQDVPRPKNKSRDWHGLPTWFTTAEPDASDVYPSTTAFEGTHMSKGHTTPHSWYDINDSPLYSRLVPLEYQRYYRTFGPPVSTDPLQREKEARRDSYTMMSVVPMLNRGFNDTIWAWHERWLRGLLFVFPYVHVITIPVYDTCNDPLSGNRITTIRYLPGARSTALPDGFIRIVLTGPAEPPTVDEVLDGSSTSFAERTRRNPLIDLVDGVITPAEFANRYTSTIRRGRSSVGVYYFPHEPTTLREPLERFCVSWEWVRDHTYLQIPDSWTTLSSLVSLVPHGPFDAAGTTNLYAGPSHEQYRTDLAMNRRQVREMRALTTQFDSLANRTIATLMAMHDRYPPSASTTSAIAVNNQPSQPVTDIQGRENVNDNQTIDNAIVIQTSSLITETQNDDNNQTSEPTFLVHPLATVTEEA